MSFFSATTERPSLYVLLMGIFFGSSCPVFALANGSDSLRQTLATLPQDTTRVQVLIELGNTEITQDFSLAKQYALEALTLSHDIDFPNGIGQAAQLLGGIYQISQQTDSSQYFFTLAGHYMRQQNDKAGLASVWLQTGNLYTLSNPDTARLYLDSALLLAQTMEEGGVHALIYSGLARWFLNQGSLDSALHWGLNAVTLRQHYGPETLLPNLYVLISSAYSYKAQYDKALTYALRGVTLCERFNNTKDLLDLWLNIGVIRYNQDNMVSSLEATQKALQLALDFNEPRALGNLYSNLGNIHYRLHAMDSANYYWHLGLEVNRQLNNHRMVAFTVIWFGEQALAEGRYEEALEYYRETVAAAQKIDDKFMVSEGYKYMALASAYLNRWLDVAELMAQSEALILEIASAKNHLEWYHTYVTIDSLDGNYLAALGHLQQANTLEDSIFTLEKNRQLEELQTQYETAKREQAIATLSAQTEVQQLELNQSNLRLVILAISLLVLILGGGLFYVLSRQKQLRLTQRAQAMEQNLLRTQMNSHFIFNALTAVQDFIQQGATDQAGYFLRKFSRLIRQVLDNSRSEFIPLEQEVALLEDYLSLHNLGRETPFEYSLEVDETLDPEAVGIPPMFAQPFVENALVHGLDRQKNGCIALRFSLSGETLHLTVRDNGPGLSQGVSPRPKHTSHATQITRERIALYRAMYRQHIDFQVNSSDAGVTVSFQLPIQHL